MASKNPAYELSRSASIRPTGQEGDDSKCDACKESFDDQRQTEDRPRSYQWSMPTRTDAQAEPAGSVGELCVVAKIVNLREIEQVYGETTALGVRHAVYERARALSRSGRATVATTGAHIVFIFDLSYLSYKGDASEQLCGPIIEHRVVKVLGAHVVPLGDAAIMPVVRASAMRSGYQPFQDFIDAANLATAGHHWCERYKADMVVAATVFVALEEKRLDFDREPVCAAGDSQDVTYYEVLLCEIRNGQRIRIGSLVGAIERLGMVRRLDEWVVDSTIAALRRNPALRLGCNVSAHSATLDAWWTPIASQLHADRHLASRLTIEITETAAMTSTTEEARNFVRTFQALGCQMALDDLGKGHNNLIALIGLGVDIVKIDLRCLRQEEGGTRSPLGLRPLIQFAKTYAASVIVEGIETEDDAQQARECGATCLQGYLYSGPSAPDIGAEKR
ncbi:EAL domain-containing protein (putative c-di-GMP-specific phosphodiesterase class I) [Paraburkholderia sp. BL18I3N2]|uniref:EAL domain-containing protein n=1 Tax=Paraburkholderia sp. BL18I3N2 TaxID=1938799 RepID=UPI000D04F153|nr:EAL domain-containing protein [Paraburkholderia sp. BL18I3N2]PRX19609.1 EAL domain-containing protein (putative c-di-GMP-specific phosphodiesterase class I) [Paraburkholderia sp. BL18I3N2]